MRRSLVSFVEDWMSKCGKCYRSGVRERKLERRTASFWPFLLYWPFVSPAKNKVVVTQEAETETCTKNKITPNTNILHNQSQLPSSHVSWFNSKATSLKTNTSMNGIIGILISSVNHYQDNFFSFLLLKYADFSVVWVSLQLLNFFYLEMSSFSLKGLCVSQPLFLAF